MARKKKTKTKIKRNYKRGTRQSSFNKRRKGLLSILIPWARRFGFAVAICAGVIWAGSWLYLSGSIARAGDWSKHQMLQASAQGGFAVENILVEGREFTDPSVLLAIVNIQKGDPLFAFDPKAAQELITQISWVQSAQVERRWPDTIYVGLNERTPLALWQSEKRLKLLDSNGDVIVTDHLERFADLVMLSGVNAPQHAERFIGNLTAEPEVYSRVETAKHVSDRRWNLHLKNGIEVKLPEVDMGLALRRLAEAQENDALMDKDIRAIDMRERDRISIRTKPGKLKDYTAKLKVEAAAKSKAGNNI